MKLDRLTVGNVGLYYVCYRLSRLGWNVMPTARNARGIDVIAYSPDAPRFVGIQVKALSKHDAVPLGSTLESIAGDFWVIVSNVVTDTPTAYVLLPNEVQERAQRAEKKGQVSYWLERKSYETDTFREAWGRIGGSSIF